MQIRPAKDTPAAIADFMITGPTPVSTTIVTQNAASPHGQTIADSSFYSQNVWTNASYLGFGAAWNFGTLLGRGYPKLAWE